VTVELAVFEFHARALRGFGDRSPEQVVPRWLEVAESLDKALDNRPPAPIAEPVPRGIRSSV